MISEHGIMNRKSQLWRRPHGAGATGQILPDEGRGLRACPKRKKEEYTPEGTIQPAVLHRIDLGALISAWEVLEKKRGPWRKGLNNRERERTLAVIGAFTIEGSQGFKLDLLM